MRDLGKFTAKEWLVLKPLGFALRHLRNKIWQSLYKKVRPKELAGFLDDARQFEGKNIALVIAFEQPWALDWLLRMSRRNLSDTTVLVFDNSRRASAKLEIERVCRANGAPYLALPANPTRHVNRSHGMAMTWVFHNVVRAIKPRLFAFLDHDLIPVERISLAERLGGQPFYGWLRVSPWNCWNLWAGYCVYNFSSVAEAPLDFLYDFSMKLDTGGRNWYCLYQKYDRTQLRLCGAEKATVRDPVTEESRSVQMVDHSWFHIGSISYNDNFRSKFEFCEHLAQALDQGTSWSALLEQAQAGK
jgi:hypothetical protein